MKSLFSLLLFQLCLLSVHSVLHLYDIVLEPIYRFTDTSANPMQAIYFTKLAQFQSVTQNSELLNISRFPAVRGVTQEMFLKDLGCEVDTCQGLPIQVIAVYSVIDSAGRLKFETTPTSSDQVLGKAGYLATKPAFGLISYDEYYSEKDDLFAYTNGKYPNQFGACQLSTYQEYRYKHVRTLGYAFTAVTIPDNLPIYTIFASDDGLPEPTTTFQPTTPKISTEVLFSTNPIWTILKNSSDGIQGLGPANLPWSPPISATLLDPTNICLLNGNFSLLSKCGSADRVLQYFDNTHTYFGFIDLFNGSPDTFLYSYIGFAFRSAENICELPLVPIREFYKDGIGYNAVAGDDVSTLEAQGYLPTGRVLGYTIDCASAQNGGIIADIPDYMFTDSPLGSSTLQPSSTPSLAVVGYYVVPVIIAMPKGSLGQQGSWMDPDGALDPLFSFGNYSNVCIFPSNSTVISKCGYASTLYQYYDITDNFYFVGIDSFGRNVTKTVIGVAFQSSENVCGFNLVPIRELYKQGTGYYIVAGDNYADLLADGYTLTRNVLGYTVDCKDSKYNMISGTLPQYELTETTLFSTTSSPETNDSDSPIKLVGIYVSPAWNVNSTVGPSGYWWGTSLAPPYVDVGYLPICLFVANSTFLPTCGPTSTLYQYLNADPLFYFFGIHSAGRNVSYSRAIGLAFTSPDNACGLNLQPIRELFKEGDGYTAVAGDNYDSLIADGYSLTGNIMGYTVPCETTVDKMITGHLPTYNWTTPVAMSPTTPSSEATTASTNQSDIVNVFVSAVWQLEQNGTGTTGVWWDTENYNPYTYRLPICIFTANATFLEQCGDTAQLYQYFDNTLKLWWIGISDFGRTVYGAPRPVGLAFRSPDNVCGLKLKAIRELYNEKTKVYTAVAGDNYTKLIEDGYKLTGNIMGYTVRCKNATDEMICAHLPKNNMTTTVAPFPDSSTTTSEVTTPSTNQSDIVNIFVSAVWQLEQNGSATTGVWWDKENYNPHTYRLPICIFTANATFLEQCGDTATLYQYFDQTEMVWWIGISDFGRTVLGEPRPIGLAFRSPDNICGLKLKPIRELYNEQTKAYTAVAGDNYTKLIEDGYKLTGNIMGYTVRCKNATDEMICAHLPKNNMTITSTTSGVFSSEQSTSRLPTSTSTLETTTESGNPIKLVGIFVSPARYVNSTVGPSGYWWGTSLSPPYVQVGYLPICLFVANSSFLPTCGPTSTLYQYLNADPRFNFFGTHLAGRTASYFEAIGLAFTSPDNACGLNLQPIRELFKEGVGYTAVAGDNYDSLIADGYSLTGNIMGYTVPCETTVDKMITGHLPRYNSTTSVSPTTPSSAVVGYYVLPVSIAMPKGLLGQQGSWMDPDGALNPLFSFGNDTNVCIFPSNSTVISKCGYASTLYQYYDITDNFYFVGIDSFGRNVTKTVIGVAFQSSENVCGFNLVPIRELYKQGTGYYIVAGDNYADLLADGYTLTGNVLGYTADCKDSKYNMISGTLPQYELTKTTLLSTTSSPETTTDSDNPIKLVGIYVSTARYVNSTVGPSGYWWGTSLAPPYVQVGYLPICLFVANSSFLPTCGPTSTLYQYRNADPRFYFFGTHLAGRTASYFEAIGLAFTSPDNACGLNLQPIRELFKEGVGYTAVAGDNYDSLIADGYSLTGNIMGYTVPCETTVDKMITGHLPRYNSTTSVSPTTPSSAVVGYYVLPVSIAMPKGLLGQQGSWMDPDGALNPLFSFGNDTNVCIFPSNSTVISNCGYASTLYQYYDITDNFYFVGIDSFGRNVTKTVIGVAFQSAENVCGFNLVPIRELYKQGTGYYVVDGDNYADLLAEGYTLTGNVLGYTADCKDSKYTMISGTLPQYELTKTSTITTPTPEASSTSQATTSTVPETTTSSPSTTASSTPPVTTSSVASTSTAPETTTITTTPSSTTELPTTTCIGSWSDWQVIPGAVCNDTCGNCGAITRHRVCEPDGCQCSGESGIDTVPCGEAVCTFPRQSCCEPFIAQSVNGKFVCALASSTKTSTATSTALETTTSEITSTQTTPTTSESTTVPTTISTSTMIATTSCLGEWSDFQPMPGAVCNDTCGRCGWISRHRVCEPEGCQCSGESGTDEVECNWQVCYFPRSPCCGSYKPGVLNRTHACLLPETDAPPTTTMTCTGEWSDWEVAPGGVCNDTCGNCGFETKQRTCLNCGCIGDTSETAPCADSVCLFPRNSCCSPYQKKVNNELREFYCG